MKTELFDCTGFVQVDKITIDGQTPLKLESFYNHNFYYNKESKIVICEIYDGYGTFNYYKCFNNKGKLFKEYLFEVDSEIGVFREEYPKNENGEIEVYVCN